MWRVACAALGYLFALAGIILGIIALVKAKNDLNPQTAKILGIVAIVLGALALLVSCGSSIAGIIMAQSGQFDWEELLRELQ